MQLLAPKYFLKWKQRHQLKYHFGPAGLQVCVLHGPSTVHTWMPGAGCSLDGWLLAALSPPRNAACPAQVDYPAPYTTCVQQLDCGAWVFPGADGTWLCARQQPQQPAA